MLRKKFPMLKAKEPSTTQPFTDSTNGSISVTLMSKINHLHQMDFVHKKPRQDPHELTEAQAKRRVEVCRQLLQNPLDDRFWKRIVISDERSIYLANHNRQKRWVPRQDYFGRKVMICVWWNFEGVLHFELVPINFFASVAERFGQPNRWRHSHLFRLERARFHGGSSTNEGCSLTGVLLY